MNILFFIDGIYPFNTGGTYRLLYELSLALKKRGNQIDIIVPSVSENKALTIHGINLYFFKLQSGKNFFQTQKYLLNALNDLINYKKFDVFSFHSCMPFFGSIKKDTFKNAFKSGKKVFTYHGSLAYEVKCIEYGKTRGKNIIKRIETFLKVRIYKQAEIHFMNNFSRIITDSNFYKDFLVNKYCRKKEDILVVPGGINLDKFTLTNNKEDIKNELGFSTKCFNLITVRRLDYRMGLFNLIKAMELLKNKDIYLRIIGKGPLFKKLGDMVKTLNIENKVELLGYVDDEKLIKYLQASDLFVLPTIALEGFGLVILEAMACGLPVMGTPVGEIPNILSKFDKNMIFSSIEPESIASGITDYIYSQQIRKTPFECREFVENHYSWDKNAIQVEEIYKKL